MKIESGEKSLESSVTFISLVFFTNKYKLLVTKKGEKKIVFHKLINSQVLYK